jgi:hypothetical protein
VTFDFFRKSYPVFTYEAYKYSISGNSISFEFEFRLNDDIIFKPASAVILPDVPQFREIIHPLIENLIFQIGMIELVSYWKATCSPQILIKAGALTKEQIDWWKELYYNGLGEFFYLNSIHVDKSDFVEIKSTGPVFNPVSNLLLDNEYIIPIGGGKDSAVTLELLKQSGHKVHTLIMNPRGATVETVETAGIKKEEIIIINRTIDQVLLQLNDRGFLNGHTPFSAMLAFYSLLAAVLTGHKNIALSNESSANEATIPGTTINHQYSKSIEFETNFRDYYTRYICPQLNYFSFLRPLSELQIMSIFSHLDKYHNVFKSCNVGSKTNSWCGKCPKCLFTHIMLSAFKGVNYANQVIGKSMLDDAENTQYFDELSGFSAIKPFECVGTFNDVQTALRIISKSLRNTSSPLLIRRFNEMDRSEAQNVSTSIENLSYLNTDELNLIINALSKD